MLNLNSLIEDIYFESSYIEEKCADFPQDWAQDPKYLEHLRWLCEREDELTHFAQQLRTELDAHYNKEVCVSKEDMKSVYRQLRDREQHPRGSFDKQGRFYLRDGELVNVRSPSVAYPYSQMQAGRTLKFVKALAEKYKCQTLFELQEVAFS